MATMKDIIQSPLLLALFGSMALGLFASSASGSKVVKGGIKGVLPVLVIMTVLSLAARLAGYGSVLGGLVGIFIIVMLVTGTLERNGLREAAAALIGKFKGATSGLVIGIYGVMRSIFAAFNVGFGGVAGFVRPVIMPMAEGAIVAQGYEPNEEHVEELKGMAAGMENITWFFGQVLFVGGSGGLLVQSTLAGLGIEVELAQLAAIEIPVCIIATVVAIVFYVIKDRKMIQKYYK